MKQLSIMIKPASSLCNLRCRYCFYTDIASLRDVKSHGVMSVEKMQKMLQNLHSQLSPGDQITFAFQGGEPTLASLVWFQTFTEICGRWEKNIKVNYSLQSNATTLNEDWCRHFAEHRYLIGVSLDILPQCHDENRVDSEGKGTYQRCLQAIELLNTFHVEYNVLCTLTRQIARHPQKVWNVLKEQNIQYVQFTPCLHTLASSEKDQYALTPQRFAQFYNQLFPLWLADLQRGKYRSVKLFDDVINLMAYGVPTMCGINGICQPQLVVEADGSVYPCDFYCLDEYRLGSILENSLQELLDAALRSPAHRRTPLPQLCHTCRYMHFCGGNCKRMQREIACTGRDQSCGYREFLNANGAALRQIVRQHGKAR